MDSSEQQAEKTLAAGIELLRAQFPQTQDLYREVCVLMFFRHGMTPTANKLYQLVRKGSMSAPAEALNRFWENLRDKSRVTIAHPDLPDGLKTAAGEMTATLWKAAQAAAQESLAIFKEEAQALLDEAKTSLALAFRERDAGTAALEATQTVLAEVRQQALDQLEKIAGWSAQNASLQEQLRQSKDAITARQQRFDAAAIEHARELDTLRNATQLAEQHFHAMQTRSLLDIDRERTATNKLQKVLDSERGSSLAAAERHRVELNASQMHLGDLRQKMGVLEGAAQAMKDARDKAVEQLQALRNQFASANAQTVAAQNDAERLRLTLKSAKKSMASHAARSKISMRQRKL